MALTHVVWKSRGKVVSLALLGGIALSTGGNTAPNPISVTSTSHAGFTPVLVTLDRQLFCQDLRAPAGSVRRCAASWHRNAHGEVVSDDPMWIPATGPASLLTDAAIWPHAGADALYVTFLPVVRAAPMKRPSAPGSAHSASWSVPSGSASAGPYGLWTPPPGHPAYALPDYAGDPNAAYYGYCTWYAQYRRQDERLVSLGNAAQWAFAAPSHGLRVGTTPAVGATVVFQPGVFGAGAGGHVAHVEAVYTGGWFLISEMNMSWNGGGWGRVSFRYSIVAPGVSFIY